MAGSETIFNWEGISLPSYWGGGFQTAGASSAFDQMKATGANTVTLSPQFFMENRTSNETALRLNSTPGQSESDTFAQVKQGIMDAAAQGFKVVLKPHLESKDRVWIAQIAPSNPDAWFASYKKMIVDYATVAQEAGASMLVIGTELMSMTGPQYADKWADIISAIRSVYSGPLTYSATDLEVKQIPFWGNLDYIGINPSFPMTTSDSPTVSQLIDAWIKPSNLWWTNNLHDGLSTVDYYKSLSTKWGKKVILTEVGYRSEDGTNKDPSVINGSGVADPQEQANLYTALYYAMENYGGQWLDGAFLWRYHSATVEDLGNLRDDKAWSLDYTIQGKAANGIVTQHYSSPAHVTGITRNGTSKADKLDGGYHNDTLNGKGGNDTLWGGKGHDKLDGGTGYDTMQGGSGNDRYYVDSTRDRVREVSADDGVDTVYAGVSHTLSAFVENLVGTGSGSLSLKGNGLNNSITGNGKKNSLSGGYGNDKLNGGSGNDTLWGGKGQDTFVFKNKASKTANFDTVKDYSVKDDSVQLDNAVLKKLGKAGALKKAFFTIGEKAKDGNDYLIYSKKTGVLSYDADGSGTRYDPVEIAKLSKNLKMTYKEFFVI